MIRRLAAVVLAASVLLGIACYLMFPKLPFSKATARESARWHVQQRLVSPVSAVFSEDPGESDYWCDLKGNAGYSETGYFEAPNRFGTLARTKYSIRLQYNKSKRDWRVQSFDIEDNAANHAYVTSKANND